MRDVEYAKALEEIPRIVERLLDELTTAREEYRRTGERMDLAQFVRIIGQMNELEQAFQRIRKQLPP